MSSPRARLPFVIVAAVLALSLNPMTVLAQQSDETDLARLNRLEKENQQMLETLAQLQAQREKEGRKGEGETSIPTGLKDPPAAAPWGGGVTGTLTSAPAPAAQPQDIKAIVNRLIDERNADKEQEDRVDGFKPGGKMPLSAFWQDGLVFSNPCKDYVIHIGGYFQLDDVSFTESGRLGKLTPDTSSVASGGYGPLQDGIFWRRVRPQVTGTIWDFYEFDFTFHLERLQFGQVGLGEFWVGVKELPIIGTVRFGHIKTVNGLEASMTASAATMTFLERSSFAQGIWQNQDYATGLWIGNHLFNDRMTWATSIYRQDITQSTSSSGDGIALSSGQSGDNFNDGTYGVGGRLTLLPIDSEDGRELLHFGISGNFREAPHTISPNSSGSLASGQPIGPRGLSISSTPEIRDSNADNDNTDSNTSAQLGGSTGAFVSTGNIFCQSSDAFGLEALAVYGPLSFQAEYGWSILNDVTGINGAIVTKATPGHPIGSTTFSKSADSYMFNGGYVQASYFLTGENRSYDRRLGRLDSVYLGKNGPNNPFYIGRNKDNNWAFGRGAWELAVRYSYLDLNDGAGLTRVNGGVEGGFSAGINWYLTNNLAYQFQYQWNDRYQTSPGGAGTPGNTLALPGIVEGFGVRMNWMF